VINETRYNNIILNENRRIFRVHITEIDNKQFSIDKVFGNAKELILKLNNHEINFLMINNIIYYCKDLIVNEEMYDYLIDHHKINTRDRIKSGIYDILVFNHSD
jgi:hypothetical protein